VATTDPYPFGQVCQAIYVKSIDKNQTAIVLALLESAGLPTDGTNTATAKTWFTGRSRPVFKNQNIDCHRLAEFFQLRATSGTISPEGPDAWMAAVAWKLGAPREHPYDLDVFVRTLAEFVRGGVQKDPGRSTFFDYYTQCVEKPKEKRVQQGQPNYRGDSATNASPALYHQATYDSLRHEWWLVNDGSVTWRNRKLVCLNPEDPRIRQLHQEQVNIGIPASPPSRSSKVVLSVELKVQHLEGEARSHWVMVDEYGDNCFPDDPELFDIVVDVTWQPSTLKEISND
jgi:hypothetical protein